MHLCIYKSFFHHCFHQQWFLRYLCIVTNFTEFPSNCSGTGNDRRGLILFSCKCSKTCKNFFKPLLCQCSINTFRRQPRTTTSRLFFIYDSFNFESLYHVWNSQFTNTLRQCNKQNEILCSWHDFVTNYQSNTIS